MIALLQCPSIYSIILGFYREDAEVYTFIGSQGLWFYGFPQKTFWFPAIKGLKNFRIQSLVFSNLQTNTSLLKKKIIQEILQFIQKILKYQNTIIVCFKCLLFGH